MGQSSSRQRGFYPPPPPFAPTYGYGYPPAPAYPSAPAYAPAPVYGHILPQQTLFAPHPDLDGTRRRRRRHRSSRKRRHDEYQDDSPDPVIPSRAGTEIHAHNERVQPGPSILRRSVGAHTPYPSGTALPQDRSSESGHDHQLAHLMAPMSPAPPAAYGPPPRPGVPPVQHHNPLPEPPRDLYASSPYNAILDLPQTTALLTASFSNDLPQKSKGIFGKGKGLLRSLSSKKKEEPRIHFVPVNVGANGYRSDAGPSGLNRSMAPSSSGSISAAPPPVAMNATSAPPPPIVQMPVPDPAEPPPPVFPEPRPDVSLSVIRITFDNEYRDFCNHSFHRVMYGNQTYDTAMHLFEAMKFLPDNPQIADNIRLCKNIGDVFPLSANFVQYQRSDWGDVHKTILEEVLYHKYGQNPDVRNLLLNTGSAELVYSDPSDSYWSEGPDGRGQNHLGKALMRVRERLKAMGYKK